MKCYDFRELRIFVEYDHSRESIIVGRRLFDINGYSRRCLKIIRTHFGEAIIRGRRLFEGGLLFEVIRYTEYSNIRSKKMNEYSFVSKRIFV